jgi:hypothetical protein
MPGRHRKPTNTSRRLTQAGALTLMTTAPLALAGTALASPASSDNDSSNSSDFPTYTGMQHGTAHRGSSDSDSDDGSRFSVHRDTHRHLDNADEEDVRPVAQHSSRTASRAGSRALRAAPTTAKDARWDSLAHCESTQNWDANTGNGFKGGLQFTDSTWRAYGGKQYATSADQASRAEQIAVAKKVQHSQGWNAWPSCSRKLGYA